MAKENEYLNEAYDTLKRISADEQKRLEYEAREKALKDYNSQMGSALRRGEKIGQERGEKIGQERGEKIGQERGEKIGLERAKQVFKLHMQGKTIEEIAKICGIETEKVRGILE